MNSCQDTPPARIYTTWGTVLYVDPASRELRHGPIETSPQNAVFVADATSTAAHCLGWLMHDTCERLEPMACGALSCRAVSAVGRVDPPVAPTLLELLPLERGLIAFSHEGRFLCAQPDGRLDLANTICSTWECFLASEDWCGTALAADAGRAPETKGIIDRKGIAKLIIDARLRIKASTTSKRIKVLIYGYPAWSHGRLFYDLSINLYKRGYIVDIINWQENHADHIAELIDFYDLVLSSLDGVSTLVDIYGVPHEQIIAVSQHEMDMRILINQKGVEVFEKFGGYAVVGYQLFDASAIFGISRRPMVAQHGVAFSEFYAEVPKRLTTVGYASSFSQKTIYGVEIKRGELAEAAARAAGLEFKMAGSGSTASQISFHDMPEFYKSVDAILITSVTEGAQLPVKEGAAAGRLVISTPVGDFPLRAYQGAGIIAPIEDEKYKKFAADTLRYYKDHPEAFTEKCHRIQDAARQFAWEHVIGDWVELIEAARGRFFEQARSHQEALTHVASEEARGDASTNKQEHLLIDRDESVNSARAPRIVSVFETINLEHELQELKKKGFSHLTDLCHMMSSFGSDKAAPFHNYTVVYDWLFSRFRKEELYLFELGLGTNKPGAPSSMGSEGKPGASLRAWRAYFPRARIYGADIDADILFQEDRIKTFWTDQREPQAIRALWDKLENVVFDIMVDDGLHEASANICFFKESLARLKPGGIYVIEDLTPQRADLVRSFADAVVSFSKSFVCEELEHPVNKFDNRLFIFQKA